MRLVSMQEYFNKYFKYKDGKLFWKKSVNSRGQKGDRAGSLLHTGYRRVSLHGVQYQEHRVIYIMHNGDIPESLEVDHIIGISNGLDNKIENLQLLTALENLQKENSSRSNTSIFYGVSYYRNTKCYHSSIQIAGNTVYLGYYDDELDAARAVNIYCKNNSIDRFNDIPDPFRIPTRRTR